MKSVREVMLRLEEEDATKSIVEMTLCLMRQVPVVLASKDGLTTAILDRESFQDIPAVLTVQNIKEFLEMTHGYAHQ